MHERNCFYFCGFFCGLGDRADWRGWGLVDDAFADIWLWHQATLVIYGDSLTIASIFCRRINDGLVVDLRHVLRNIGHALVRQVFYKRTQVVAGAFH